jgi:hypothetical protein
MLNSNKIGDNGISSILLIKNLVNLDYLKLSFNENFISDFGISSLTECFRNFKNLKNQITCAKGGWRFGVQ